MSDVPAPPIEGLWLAAEQRFVLRSGPVSISVPLTDVRTFALTLPLRLQARFRRAALDLVPPEGGPIPPTPTARAIRLYLEGVLT